MSSAGLELTILAIKRLQIYTLDRTATGIGVELHCLSYISSCHVIPHHWIDVFYSVSECELKAHEQDESTCFVFGTDCHVPKFDSKKKGKLLASRV
jgi:hypothetical protein